jgi:hypothetical protein
MTDLDFTATSFDDYRVGDLFALLRSPDYRFRPNLPSADLMKLVQAGVPFQGAKLLRPT